MEKFYIFEPQYSLKESYREVLRPLAMFFIETKSFYKKLKK
jgi:hypothetical protein